MPNPVSIELTANNYTNRELSNLDFQRRVLALAENPNTPLLERLKFIAIVGSNLDEFFMVRVATYLQKVQIGITATRPDGITPLQLLRRIREEVTDIISEQRRLLMQVLSQLEAHGIFLRAYQELAPELQAILRQYFLAQVFPVLTPLAVDHARPFPFISNLSLNLAVMLERQNEEDAEFARIKVPAPDVFPRLVNVTRIVEQYTRERLPEQLFIYIEDLIMNNLADLFPGMRITAAAPFRVLRNADIDYEHEQETLELEDENGDEMHDVMSIIEQSIKERRFGSLVRVSVPSDIHPELLKRLLDGLEVRYDDTIYSIEGALGTANLFELAGIDRPDLKYPPYVPKFPEPLPPETNVFAAMRRGDILLHHPYDSFTPVEEFFRQAASDPDVLAIKATLYRVGKNSPVVQALMDARDNEKQVTVLVELKARFDEENNLEWARAMEAKGVHVIYGVEELPVKTHAKVAMVVRREADGLRRYVHLGTGNYNATTARLYTDLGILTCNEEIAEDTTRLFNRLTGYAPNTEYRRLLVAPKFLLNRLLELIQGEIDAAQAGKPARIVMKMNQLEEDRIIQKLYEASQAGVKIDLMVRGLCCLRAGLAGISENIRVISLVGRFLEHSRIFYFANAPAESGILLGSADMMRRNLYNRVEVVFPVLDARLRRRVLRILNTFLRDNVGSWEMLPDGSYQKRAPHAEEQPFSAQSAFMSNSSGLPDPLS